MMTDKGVQVLLTGNVGPNAFQTLSSAGIQIVTGVTGTVKEAIQRFKSGQFQPVSGATVPDHFGAGGGGGFPGVGMGRGMGRRGGMGGFHLGSKSEHEIQKIIANLKELGVIYVGPCHCSGDKARKLFQEAYGEKYLQVGAGRIIIISEKGIQI